MNYIINGSGNRLHGPTLPGNVSVAALVADRLHKRGALLLRQAVWYEKTAPTFSDARAAVRRAFGENRILLALAERRRECKYADPSTSG